MPDHGSTTYDAIGRAYAKGRRPDTRLAAAIRAAIGDGRSVLNVGAGTGSYEPRDRAVIAVDPSRVMLAQRPSESAPALQARAEALPFRDGEFHVALAVLTMHHWTDRRLGLEECARVARERVVVLTWDPESEGFWLVRDYFPDLLALDRRIFPRMDLFQAVFGSVQVIPVPIPADCADGFLGAFWRRPGAYLDPEIRASMSSFARVGDPEPGLEQLSADLTSGEWRRRNALILGRPDLDIGYRLVIAKQSPQDPP